MGSPTSELARRDRQRAARLVQAADTLASTMALARLTLRRDRTRLGIWAAALVALPVLGVVSMDSLYPTPADLQVYADTAGSSPAAIALNGPGHGLDQLGGVVVFEIGGYLAIAMALLNVFTVGRNTRAEEEIGRLELFRSAVVGRHAALAATLLVVATVNVAVGAAVAVGMGLLGVAWSGAILFGVSLTAIGLTFAAITAVAAQLAEYVRGTYAIAGAALGFSYVIRAAGDVGDGTLSWLSPVGWAQATRAFDDERWWPLALIGVFVVLAVGTAVVLESRRDLGGGLVPQRPGPAVASRTLRHQLGLVWRLHRGSIAGWSVGVLIAGAAFGMVGNETEDMLADSPELIDLMGGAGRDLTDVFFQMTALIVALAVTGYTVSSALRARAEEQAGRVEPLLAGALGRSRWNAAQLVVPALGAAALLTIAGVAAGVAHAATTGEADQVARILGATVSFLPAVWLIGGLAVALFGVAPRLSLLAWGVLAASAVASLLGEAFQLPNWARNLSPFEHVPDLPGGDVSWGALTALTALAIGLTAAGVVGFRRRDLYTT